ncbi:MAG: glycosyltransferase family 2 protein [Actinomyces sp.]|nr:glycosyltransferase family 2 protein [Actinomyces sp.]
MSPTQRSVGAILVTRGEAPLTQSVLRAIENQSVAPRSLTIIDVAGRRVTPFPADRVPDGAALVRVGRARNLGDAIRRAQAQGAPFTSEQWWWILHEDSAPEPECLDELIQAAAVGRTVGAVGVKQMSWDGSRLLELGIFATASARRLERIGDDDIDQGQHDGTSDVLGVGTAGLFISAEAYEAVGGFDPALGPFGDGLDMGRRLHLAGYRVIVAPKARVRHARVSLYSGFDAASETDRSEPTGDVSDALVDGGDATDGSFRKRRYAQMYNWCKAVPALLLPFLALWLLVWSPARALGRILTGRASLALPEIGALVSLIGATPRLLAGRARAAQSRRVPRSALRALETAPGLLRKEPAGVDEDEHGERIDPLVVASMRRYRVRSASTALGLLIMTATMATMQWWGTATGLVGGAWVSLPSSWSELWGAAWSAWIPGGDGYAGGADPLTILMAILSAPFAPMGVTPGALATFLLVASTPIAAMLAWIPSRALTSSLRVRFLVSLAWSLAPSLLMSATHGVLAATLAHAALPVFAAYCVGQPKPLMVAGAGGVDEAPLRPRGINGGCAALALVALACCVPWMLPLGAAVLAWRSRRSLLAALPALVLLVPTYVSIAAHPTAWPALASTSGGVHAYTRSDSWMAMLGMPAAPSTPLEAVALCIIGAGVIAAAGIALLRLRTRFAALAFCGALVSAAAGWAASQIGVGISGAFVASAWTAPALSLSFGALLALAARSGSGKEKAAEASRSAWDGSRPFAVRALGALTALVLAGAGGGVAASSFAARSDAADIPTFTLAQRSTVSPMSSPIVSAVAAQAQRSTRAGRILVLDGDPTHGTVNASLWRGSGPSLTDGSPATRALALAQARSGAAEGVLSDPATASLAQAAYTLVVYPDDATVAALAAHDVDTILVPLGASGSQALTSGLDRASGLEKVGDTNSGTVWRVRPNGVTPSRVRVESASGVTTPVGGSQLSVSGDVDASGTLVLAERADSGWRASVDGTALAATEAADGWSQAFEMPTAGHLTLTYAAWWIIPWRIASGVCLVVAAASALSAWRKR